MPDNDNLIFDHHVHHDHSDIVIHEHDDHPRHHHDRNGSVLYLTDQHPRHDLRRIYDDLLARDRAAAQRALDLGCGGADIDRRAGTPT